MQKINELGMIDIPLTIRKELSIEYKDKVEIYIESENIILKKITDENEVNDKEIVRTVDELGRVIIPSKIRKLLYINNGDEFEIFTSNNTVVIKKQN